MFLNRAKNCFSALAAVHGVKTVLTHGLGQAGIPAERRFASACAKPRKPRRFEIGRAAIGVLDLLRDFVREHRRQSEADMDRRQQPLLHRLVAKPSTALNGEIPCRR